MCDVVHAIHVERAERIAIAQGVPVQDALDEFEVALVAEPTVVDPEQQELRDVLGV